jgi:hypothetical protein
MKIDKTSITTNGPLMMGIVGFYCPKCKSEMALSGGLWCCMNPDCIAHDVKITILTTKEMKE